MQVRLLSLVPRILSGVQQERFVMLLYARKNIPDKHGNDNGYMISLFHKWRYEVRVLVLRNSISTKYPIEFQFRRNKNKIPVHVTCWPERP